MATDQPILVIDQNGASYPILLAKHLGKDAPYRLWAIGRLDLINIPKTALSVLNAAPAMPFLRPGIFNFTYKFFNDNDIKRLFYTKEWSGVELWETTTRVVFYEVLSYLYAGGLRRLKKNEQRLQIRT